MGTLVEWLGEPEQAGLRRAFGTWLSRVFLPARLPGVSMPEVMDLMEVKSMLAEHVIEWTKQWEQEGFQKGLEQARSALVGELEQRFGPVPDSVRERIRAIDSFQEIVALSARAATASSLDDLGLS